MSTPTPQTNYLTAQRIIRMAYKDAGLIQDGDQPTSEQYADGLTRMNDVANLWQTQGLKLWLIEDIAITLIPGQATYTPTYPNGSVSTGYLTKPTRIIEAYYLDQTQVRRPLIPLSWHDWVTLSQVNQQGQLNSYFVNKQQYQLQVSFWLIPDANAATGQAHLVTQTQVTNMVSLTDNMAFPTEWAMGLRWGLADELATGQPQAIMDRCERRANQFRMMLEDWDVEDAPTSFAPDQRTGYAVSSFR
jgi:hypothetical protein